MQHYNNNILIKIFNVTDSSDDDVDASTVGTVGDPDFTLNG